jgi:hypothetical protein
MRRAQTSNQRIDSLEEQLLEVVKCTITACETLENEPRESLRKNIELKTKQLNLEIALAELRLSLASERTGKPIDLPNLLRSVN